MAFSELMVRPMRDELTRLGLEELRTAAAVDAFMERTATGTALVAVNSTCGCAAGSLRPALRMALAHRPAPAHMASVFAGQDPEATARARERFTPYPPSSPALALFRDGALVWMLQRSEILGRAPEDLALTIGKALEELGSTGAG